MSAERHYTWPHNQQLFEELQEKLEEACVLYEEIDTEIERLQKNRKIAWAAFNFLKEQVRAGRERRATDQTH